MNSRFLAVASMAFLMGVVCTVVPSATAATAVLQATPSVTPETVTPGGVGAISLTLKNAGDATASRIQTTIRHADAPIQINQTGTLALGGLGALDSTTLVPFTFTVARDAAPGIYRVDADLDFTYLDGGATKDSGLSYSTPIVVRAVEGLLVQGISPDRIEGGMDSAAVITIANTATSEFLNIAGTWNSTDDVLLPVGGSNQFTIPSIGPGETAQVPVRLAGSAGADSGLYAIVFDLEYVDTAGNPYTSSSNVGVWLGSGSASDLSIKVQNLTDDEITIVVLNVGIKPVTGVQVRLIPLDGVTLDDSETIVLGNLLAGEFKTATYEIRRTGAGDARADVEYTDSSGQRRSASEPLALGESDAVTTPSSVAVALITALAIFAVQGVIVAGWAIRKKAVSRRQVKEIKDEADFAELARGVRQDAEDMR